MRTLSTGCLCRVLAPAGAVAALALFTHAVIGADDNNDLGRAVFDEVCYQCHGTGFNGAPVIGDGPDWAVRKRKGLDQMLKNALDGIGQMPARGGCLDCSDAEIEAAVRYIFDWE